MFQEFKQVLNGKCLKTEDKIILVGEHAKASLLDMSTFAKTRDF